MEVVQGQKLLFGLRGVDGKRLGKRIHTTSWRRMDQVALFTQSSCSWGDTMDNSSTWRTDGDQQGPASAEAQRDDRRKKPMSNHTGGLRWKRLWGSLGGRSPS